MTDSYFYRLCFEKKVKNETGVETDLWLENVNESEVVLDSVTYSMTLRGIAFNRKIYQPGEIEAEILFVENTSNDNEEMSHKVSSISGFFLNSSVSLFLVKHDRHGDEIDAS